VVARGKPEWVTALPRTDLSWLQRFIQSHVQLSGYLADTSIRLIQVDPIETASAQEHPFVACTAGKLLGTASHLVVCVSTREAGREAASRTGADQAGQSKRRDRLQVGPSVHAHDLGAGRTAVGRLAERGTASHLPELESFAKGIQQDKAAVLAGLTLPWSTGPVEGHVNRLKLMKRSMYGRAKLPRLARTCAACGQEGAFSRSSAGWIVMRLTQRREQVRAQHQQMGTSKLSTTNRSKEDDEDVI
jgi:hypothetical protein